MPPYRTSDEQFRAAVADPTVRTIADLCRRLGLVPRGGNYETVRRRATGLGIDLAHLAPAPAAPPAARTRRPRDVTDREIVDALARSLSVAEALRRLGFAGDDHAARRRVDGTVTRLGVSTAHLVGQAWAKGQHFPERRLRPEQLGDGRVRSGEKIRRCLIGHGLKEHRCERCRRTTWEGGPIPLEVDHIDGDRRNGEVENLQLLCPNCHALTPTYRGRNRGRYD